MKTLPPGGRLGLGALLGLAISTGLVGAQAPEPPQSPPSRATRAASPPRLNVESSNLDLGQVPPGGKAEATFIVRNTGGEVLRLLSVKPG